MIELLWNIGSFVVCLGILITVHEYGHFWVARKNGIKVERFSIGFGKALWRKTDKQGTEYVVAAIPLGGYVKMLDERVDDVAEEDKPHAFNNKSVYQRIAVVSAGPIANFIFAIFAFYLMFLIGVPSVKPVVQSTQPNSIAATANIPTDLEIIQVGKKKTENWRAVNMALVSHIGEPSIVIQGIEPGNTVAKEYRLDTRNWQYSPEKESAITSLGLNLVGVTVLAELATVEAGSPADNAGLQIGDKLLSINGESVEGDWYTFSQRLREFPNTAIDVGIERAGETLTVSVVPAAYDTGDKVVGYLGVRPKVEPVPDEYRYTMRYSIIDSVGKSIERTWDLIVLSLQMIGKLITGDVSVKNLSGPIAIAQGAGDSAGYGIVYFLGFLALISINLGIINLLPLPVLDGGHLLYYLVELLTGKPVPERVQEVGFRIGAIVLLALMSIALFNDLSRL
ncbi:sigma E protease regulator RseP [Thalassotalea agarivorans]|uniref:Zinc metalloprotease n=1 Tax=Thalassotalea agarivorans TaxID=349064 RepID=A0A1H9ZTW3_THASX|nr:sigma E protease regulator RseP [Thalassotalea agarivorans]SES84783.1 site-2 protease. Metallo peptidase. MEROPS family M50B [Thalassotalea agarivorans]